VNKKKKDCAIKVMKNAKSKWQKSVGEVLIEVEQNIEILRTDYKWVKWLVTAIFIMIIGLVIKVGIGG